MPTKDPELDLRHKLRDVMKPVWVLTWHEDREINPGVPDVSYVMREPPRQCETGWLELKAVRKPPATFRIKIEPSQHQWISDHLDRIPIHFLVAVDEIWYLVPARYHMVFAHNVNRGIMSDIAQSIIAPPERLPKLRAHLTAATYRGRNEIQGV